jgi:nucleotide-binding universal stress UspA family protein
MRVILVPLLGDDDDALALQAAHCLAVPFQSHVDAIFLRPAPEDAIALVGEGMSAELVESIMAASRATWDARDRVARAAFDAARSAADAPLAERPMTSTSVTTRWQEVVGLSSGFALDRGRLADLVVLSAAGPDSHPQRQQLLEAILFRAARPLLRVGRPLEAPPRRVAILWNGSAEATRAVAGALPLLGRAEAVHVLSAPADAAAAGAAARLADYLGWHGLVAKAHELNRGGDAAARLLDQARALEADLLVLGGYGHSRMRELIFGGVTRAVLGQRQLPVLLAH